VQVRQPTRRTWTSRSWILSVVGTQPGNSPPFGSRPPGMCERSRGTPWQGGAMDSVHPSDALLCEPSPEPHVAVIFTSVRLDGTAGDAGLADEGGYAEMADRMDALSREQPGYLGIDSARGADGVGITVSYWATEADAVAWKQVAEHLGAQRLGRERWYRGYTTRVATVTRSYAWQRDDQRGG
jgi:heme-degrading monooxygenase HmoA